MDEGCIVEEAPPEEFFANPKNEKTRNFLGQILVSHHARPDAQRDEAAAAALALRTCPGRRCDVIGPVPEGERSSALTRARTEAHRGDAAVRPGLAASRFFSVRSQPEPLPHLLVQVALEIRAARRRR